MNGLEKDAPSTTEARYEDATVKAIRGTESRTISKWQSEGWEFVSQTSGTLRTEIVFRRPKPRSRRRVWGIGAGVAAMAIVGIIVVGIMGEQNTAPTAPTVDSAGAPESAQQSPAATGDLGDESDEDLITAQNNADLAELLALPDYCDSSIKLFAEKYSGRTVGMDANIGAIGPHSDYTTRYDILIGAGDYSETSAPGPAFQFRDVNMTSDLHFVTEPPSSIGVGTNLRVTARVGDYRPESCLFSLEPVSTSVK